MPFSAQWLALREPTDLAARNRAVLAAVADAFREHTELAIADLACGTGSTLRAIAATLPATTQQWTLVDHDPALLAAGREQLIAWADRADERGAILRLEKSGRTIDVTFLAASLDPALDCLRDREVDLVTASAFFDLVSADWIAKFVKHLAVRRLPLYAALNYDGVEEWQPAHAAWPQIHDAFLQHQRRDKGFGPAAGPDAAAIIADAFRCEGYSSAAGGPSPWQLGAEHAGLVKELASGIATAVSEQQPDLERASSAWATTVREAAEHASVRAIVGHADVWSGTQGR